MNYRKILFLLSALISFLYLAPVIGRAFMVMFLGQSMAVASIPLTDYWLGPLTGAQGAPQFGSGVEIGVFYLGFGLIFILSTFLLHRLGWLLLQWVKK